MRGAITPGQPSPDAIASDPPARGRVTLMLVFRHSPLGESRPEGPERGGMRGAITLGQPSRTLSRRFRWGTVG